MDAFYLTGGAAVLYFSRLPWQFSESMGRNVTKIKYVRYLFKSYSFLKLNFLYFVNLYLKAHSVIAVNFACSITFVHNCNQHLKQYGKSAVKFIKFLHQILYFEFNNYIIYTCRFKYIFHQKDALTMLIWVKVTEILNDKELKIGLIIFLSIQVFSLL